MKYLTVVSLLMMSFLGLNAQATIELITTDKYSEIREDILELTQTDDPKKILLAFDIDETLLVVEDCLPEGESAGFLGWLKMARTCPANLTEDVVDDYLIEFQELGFPTLALTARADNLLAATERELARNNLNFLGEPFNATADFEHPFTKRSKVVFKNGVTYSASKNKGEVLKILLERLPKTFTEVVFIDDGIKNIRAMTRVWENDPTVHVRIYHYTKYNEVEK